MKTNREYQYDVIVAGGGTAGAAAAAGAAQAGAKTLLIERNPYLGGEATHSGVGAFCGFYSCGKNPVKVVAGIGDCVLRELELIKCVQREGQRYVQPVANPAKKELGSSEIFKRFS